MRSHARSKWARRAGAAWVAAWLLVGASPAVHAAIPAAERAALIALYVATNGNGWLNKTGWKTPPLAEDGFSMPGTECSWYLVWCDVGETTVLEIDLGSNSLSGSIPAALGDLGNLQVLSLASNQLSGAIPPELGSLSSLVELSLYDNGLSGSLPPQLGSLANLRILWLDGNELTGGIPPELGSLASLEALFLFGNQLSGSIPPELGSLAQLRALYLNGNLLTGSIPAELGQLASLRSLFLYSNRLSGSIPPALGNLTVLQQLLLDGNRLSGVIPPELGNLSALLYTYLDDNALVGPVPVELMDLVNLQNGKSNFCNNSLYTSDAALSSFLDAKQIGGNWAACQAVAVPAISGDGVPLLCMLLLGSALWSTRRSEAGAG